MFTFISLTAVQNYIIHFIYFNSLIFLLKQSTFWTTSNIWVAKTWNPLYLMPCFDIPLAMPHGGVFIHDCIWPSFATPWTAGRLDASFGSLRASSPFGGVVRSHTRAARERRHKVIGELASRRKLLVETTSGIVCVNKHFLWLADDIQSQPVIDYTECPNGKKSLCQRLYPLPTGKCVKTRLNVCRKEKETGSS